MKLYVLVEGRRTEKKVYESWLRILFPGIKPVCRLEDLADHSFFIVSGNGYPRYLDHIRNSISDLKSRSDIDALLICVDCEDKNHSEKLKEIASYVTPVSNKHGVQIVAHDCCIETWFLANEKMLRKIPESPRLKDFKSFYDVSTRDPELMDRPGGFTTRAGFHLAYLKEMLAERKQTYTKLNPGCVLDREYLSAIFKRSQRTQQMNSLRSFFTIVRQLGGGLNTDSDEGRNPQIVNQEEPPKQID